jgi:hypothetical protein
LAHWSRIQTDDDVHTERRRCIYVETTMYIQRVSIQRD